MLDLQSPPDLDPDSAVYFLVHAQNRTPDEAAEIVERAIEQGRVDELWRMMGYDPESD